MSVAILMGSKAPAQWHMPDQPEYKWLRTATEQYNNGHYAVAVQSAQQYLHGYHDNVARPPQAALEHARYYITLANLKLATPGIADSAKNFIASTANPVYKQRTAHALAQYYFRKNELQAAIPYYELAGIANLSNEEIIDAKFELAYAYFNNKQFDKAQTMFAAIKELAGMYNEAGNYYYGLLAYNQGQYQDAMRSFEKIQEQREYRNIVPYYIAEIHYFTGNKKQALADAQRLIKRQEKMFYDKELHLLAAQVLFEDRRYGEALPYFEHYYNNADQIRKEDLYEMGYSYYRVNEWQNAIEKFKLLNSTQDTLGQTAMYLLGDCYLKTGDKKSARNAFRFCADMPFNQSQREASLMLAARLNYELGFNDEAMAQIRTLQKDYPASVYRDESNTLLSDILIKSNNYPEAYNLLQEVANRDKLYWDVFQKVTYGYGLQHMENGKLSMADSMLSLSLQKPQDATYEAAAHFWKGEIAYQSLRYADALYHAQQFLDKGADNKRKLTWLSPAATTHDAYMMMGYASLEQKEYPSAQTYFIRAQQAPDAGQQSALTATLREADAVFMLKGFNTALALYDKVIVADGADADYARFQKATILGMLGRNAEKSTLLQTLSDRGGSAYADDARYEMAVMQIETNQYQKAITTLEPILNGNGKNSVAPKAWLRTAFAYDQLNKEEDAIDAYRQVVIRYPSSEERQAALDALKSIYIERNEPGAYAKLVKDNNLLAAGDPTIDSAYYAAGEAQFAAGKYAQAKSAFQEYMVQYPTGLFTTKANYYKAESHYQLKEYSDALNHFKAVLNRPWSDYTENSARRASYIAYALKDYKGAAEYYQTLRSTAMDQESLQQAYYGLMQSNYNLNQKELAGRYADTLMTIPGVNESMKQEAQLYKARGLQEANKPDEALAVYKQLVGSRKSALAAEARYQVAAIYLAQGKLKEAEDAASNSIRLSGDNDYWVVKSYILLSDILVKQNDYFNAVATLQSIVQNAKIPALKEEATKKLEEAKALEKKQSKLSD